MKALRLASSFVVGALPVVACSCFSSLDACQEARTTGVAVFVARVIADAGEAWGRGPARIVIEEPVQNVPEGLTETLIDVQAGTSCYFHLRAGERWLLMADRRDGRSIPLATRSCSNSFRLPGQEHVLEALRLQAAGVPSATGVVRRGRAGVGAGTPIRGARVTLKPIQANGQLYETSTDAAGVYRFRGIEPGQYLVSLDKAGFLPDELANRPLNTYHKDPETGKSVPEERPQIRVDDNTACAVRGWWMYANGQISGKIVSNGVPVQGVAVQAFERNADGTRGPTPFRTAVSSEDGRYVISPVPAGIWTIAVNDSRGADETAWRPTASPELIRLGEGESASGVDLELGAPRVPSTLTIDFVGPDGRPFIPFAVDIRNRNGNTVLRQVNIKASSVQLPAYVGEEYAISAYRYDFAAEHRGETHVRIEIPKIRTHVRLVVQRVP